MRIYNITEYGALEANATAGIQAAIDNCFKDGGGEVQIPEGTWCVGGLRLRSHVVLHLLKNAVLSGSRDPEDYCILEQDTVEPVASADKTEDVWTPAVNRKSMDFCVQYGSRWNNGLIRALHAENVSLIGEEGSMICGNNCYDAQGEEDYRGPHGISMHDCRNVTIRGITTKDTGNWAYNIADSDNIVVENVLSLAGHDGVHFTNCSNITVQDSEFYTGDDCIAGISNVNVYIENCVLNTACSGMRFGGTNVFARKCHFYGPARYLFRGSLSLEEKISGTENRDTATHRYNMLSAFTYYSDFSRTIPIQPSHILIEDCKIENTDRLVHYNFSGNETWQKNKPLEDLTLRNIQVTGLGMPLNLYGAEECPVSFTAKNVSIALREDFTSDSLIHLCHYDQIRMRDVSVEGPIQHLIKRWSDDGDIDTSGVTFRGVPAGNTSTSSVCGSQGQPLCEQLSEPVVEAKEPFFAKAI